MCFDKKHKVTPYYKHLNDFPREIKLIAHPFLVSFITSGSPQIGRLRQGGRVEKKKKEEKRKKIKLKILSDRGTFLSNFRSWGFVLERTEGGGAKQPFAAISLALEAPRKGQRKSSGSGCSAKKGPAF